MAVYCDGLEVKVKELLLQVKMQTQNKSGRGIRYLKVNFKRYDANGNSKLDPQQLESDLICAKSICLFTSSYFLIALRMSQKQRIKEGVFR